MTDTQLRAWLEVKIVNYAARLKLKFPKTNRYRYRQDFLLYNLEKILEEARERAAVPKLSTPQEDTSVV